MAELGIVLCLLPLLCFLLPHTSHGGFINNDKQSGSVLRLKSDDVVSRVNPTRDTQLSWRPRAFLYKGFLTHEECDHLIQLAKDKLQISMVADNESGKSMASQVRTSSGMFLKKAQDDVVARIEDRIAAWTFLPPENGEAMQVLHYKLGQRYEPHFDYFRDKVNQQVGGHRIATVLMYLSDVEKGGETIFPNSEAKEQQPKDDSDSDCAKKGYAVKPVKGDALLFFSLHPNATIDPLSLHGVPLLTGKSGLQLNGSTLGLLRNPSAAHVPKNVWMKTQIAFSGLEQGSVKKIRLTWLAMRKQRDIAGRAVMSAENV